MNNQLFKSFHYFVNYPSFSNTHREVKVFYIYKCQNVVKSILIKKVKEHNDEAYYINEAKKIINLMIKNNELEQDAIKCLKRQKREKRIRTIIPSLGICCALAATAVGLYIALRPISFKEDAENMINAYKEIMCETIDSSYYDGKTVDQIMHDAEHPILEKTISGVPTYYFDNLDYDDIVTRDDFWPAKDHAIWARAIALSAYKSKNDNVMEIARKLIGFWVLEEHRCSNWFWNEIGGNRDISGAAIYCFDSLPEKTQVALLGRLERSSFYYRPETKTHTGSNLVDFADITLKSSLLRKNKEEFNMAVTRMEEEITDENVEGFQKDGEFFQHGQHVQTTSSYGRSAFRMGGFMRVVNQSKLRKFNKKKLDIISRYIADGLAPATHKGIFNYLTMSREYVRQGHMDTHDTSINVHSNIKNFIETEGMPRANEIKEYSDNVDNLKSTFSGLRYFDKGRMIMINTDDLYLSFKGTADYLVNTECNSDENRLGLNLSYGTNTCVMDTGLEYNNIIPVWDYAYLPGTTSYQLADPSTSGKEEDFDKYFYDSDQMIDSIRSDTYYKDGTYIQRLPATDESGEYGYYYGGGIDEENGVAYLMQRSCHHKENYFTVTCIATKDGMVLLGADTKYDGSVTEGPGKLFDSKSRTLHTTLEQAFAKPEQTSLSDDSKELTFGNAFYRILDSDNKIILNEKEVTGDWRRNRKHDYTTEDPITVTSSTTKAYINHTDRSNAKYAYSIQHKNHQDEKFELVHNFDNDNKNKVQEVKLPNGLYAIASYEHVDNYQPAKEGSQPITLEKGDFIII